MLRLGKMSKCCCFPLAGGCIIGIMIHIGFCISAIFSHGQEYRILLIITNAILASLLTLGLALKSSIIFCIAAISVAFILVNYLISFVLIFITLFIKDKYTLESKLFTTIIVFIMLLTTTIFFNIYLSTFKVMRAGGTGWEYKNYMEIESQKQLQRREEKKEEKKEESGTYSDYKA
ncbi:conserved Plasmodium protein, unknown function [Plasmodium knowlesi strain H]|uniref:Uncharacterized protein n=3 Tax=Plasmodium knowlesi TaxID=5850 RepID=A0A5K1UPI7_PLAKH|nr:conserved protein, unknown function [Plasmodium knowlesi strain H]OTN65988.1 Uncharacterized protein PKNOH_S100039300 [Plasmodium knowlesi]CAA9987756.1 conserved protein, unknown function [Plasmodium knowlesi strain H]SBO27080.1 conserved Plasmodium protein, unknown function [Plasmodium knowlesi strain H]SBO29441.1 conserved Plasmodium protein, unknown function [Plasmodium knowlesi strain H]VVS77230.1 conserved protein, unknown function [Plasmodium knowlesi strain H]|eukprot:XP_002258753.1 hypothetical protein, conserved in Plasmodium species [Plasmodium knowlesi strain H]